MKVRRSLLLISFVALIFGGFLIARRLSRAAAPQSAAPASSAIILQAAQVKEIEGYRNWRRVNPQPVNMDLGASTLCVAPTQVKGADKNPHLNKFITVYVNETGGRQMMEELAPRFPQGSVIVKEKLSARDSSEPELLTVMIKRERGFNPETGDWEFMVTDGAGRKVQARGKLSSCQSCHVSMSDTDFIYRSYLPASERRRLR